MPEIHYSFKLSNFNDRIPDNHYITLPTKFDYSVSFTTYLKHRSKIILDQITPKSLYLKDLKDSYFDVSVRKYLESIEIIQPTLAFIPACDSRNFTTTENIEFTKELHKQFSNKFNHNNLAGLILGDNPDEWIKWIKLGWGKSSWGINTSDNFKAIKMLMDEASELDHIHLFENNWLIHQEKIKALKKFTINTITFDGSLYDLLKATKQTIKLEDSSLNMVSETISRDTFLETIEKFLKI